VILHGIPAIATTAVKSQSTFRSGEKSCREFDEEQIKILSLLSFFQFSAGKAAMVMRIVSDTD
jgi:hypothetical protein